MALLILLGLAAAVGVAIYLWPSPTEHLSRQIVEDELRASAAAAQLRREADETIRRVRGIEQDEDAANHQEGSSPRVPRGLFLLLGVLLVAITVVVFANAGSDDNTAASEPIPKPPAAVLVPGNGHVFIALERSFDRFRRTIWALPDQRSRRVLLTAVGRQARGFGHAIEANPLGPGNAQVRQSAQAWRVQTGHFRKEIARALRKCGSFGCRRRVAHRIQRLVQ